VQARQSLETDGIATRVVSMPCLELFELQDRAFQDEILGQAPVTIAIEAAVRQGWDRYVGRDGGFIGMAGFGASAPAPILFDKFGITVEAIIAEARSRLDKRHAA
jgi:transketolase